MMCRTMLTSAWRTSASLFSFPSFIFQSPQAGELDEVENRNLVADINIDQHLWSVQDVGRSMCFSPVFPPSFLLDLLKVLTQCASIQ